MRTLNRNQRKIGLCQRYTVDGIDLYHSPIFLYLNYRKTNGGVDVTSFGATYNGYIRMVTTPEIGRQFTPLDKVYIEAPVEDEFDGSAQQADYQVLNVTFGLNQAEILVGRLQNA